MCQGKKRGCIFSCFRLGFVVGNLLPFPRSNRIIFQLSNSNGVDIIVLIDNTFCSSACLGNPCESIDSWLLAAEGRRVLRRRRRYPLSFNCWHDGIKVILSLQHGYSNLNREEGEDDEARLTIIC